MRKCLFLVLVAVVGCPPTNTNKQDTHPSTLDQARTLLDSGNPSDATKAAELLKRAAAAGVADAQFALGLLYFKGTGVKRDQAEAIRWYARAAENQSVEGTHLMSVVYRNGCGGTTRDVGKAEEMLRRARELAKPEQLRLIEGIEALSDAAAACAAVGFSQIPHASKKEYDFRLREYSSFEFTGWDLQNRKRCPSERAVQAPANIGVYIDPNRYDVDKWCQCYLANIELDPTEVDFNDRDQQITYYTQACQKEAALQR